MNAFATRPCAEAVQARKYRKIFRRAPTRDGIGQGARRELGYWCVSRITDPARISSFLSVLQTVLWSRCRSSGPSRHMNCRACFRPMGGSRLGVTDPYCVGREWVMMQGTPASGAHRWSWVSIDECLHQAGTDRGRYRRDLHGPADLRCAQWPDRCSQTADDAGGPVDRAGRGHQGGRPALRLYACQTSAISCTAPPLPPMPCSNASCPRARW